jgi:Cu-Zn family superoxide dismutase
MKRTACTIFALAALAACAGPQGSGGATGDSAATMPPAAATLRDAAGTVKAQASMADVNGGVRVSIEAVAMAPGAYGAHIHTVGRCDPPDFASAGPHWNPTSRQHGKDNPQGAHKGDLPNLLVGADGRGSVSFTVDGVSLRGGATPVLDADGASVMIHAAADDYRTDPSGNSGARIACGVFG